MPYRNTADLPTSVKTAIPAEAGQRLFMNVVNAQLAADKTEEVAFASAWAALKRAGYAKTPEGKWVKKVQPSTQSVHTPRADWDMRKAEYQGRKVTLDKPFRLPAGSSKKFGVYVKDGDRVKRVVFGDPNMEIRRDDAEARANFRARHSCDTATDKTSARYWSCRMWTAGSTVREVAKRILNDDMFTLPTEAEIRSSALGLGGAIHIHQMADGQAVYMPGEDHEAYLDHMVARAGVYAREDMEEGYDEDELEEESDSESDDLLERVIYAIVQALNKGADMNDTFVKTADVIKVDGERRIAWGWASVSTLKGELVVDRQGDTITPTEMEKMADGFMASARTAKAMHAGEGVGEVLHSLPLTAELAKALGLETDREGWIIGMKIHDDDTWSKFKSGELAAFSIGGKAKRKEIV